ncbi:hypothetical protein [Amycolatopsis sp. PS_44_ISF1]|uniref:hypothetical protein n=1 Tax=Amycolatopsis sp. PS_44_ISF1 TaxID=2974917 RepID=UPI0028DF16D4|nr:hypothetical protein [Amycolatopsis sp. PS_44_ISF1]MDT8910822.1 hypothetical protein [Amycolatopsis sp. PS_44_ISF1]
MAEHAEAEPEEVAEPKPKRAPIDWRRGREQVFSPLASIVRWIGLIFAALLVLHVIFVIGEANAANGIVSFVRSWADGLSLGFKDLFTPSDAKLRVLVNYGIAAVFWLVVSAILARIIRRIGGIGAA